VIKQVPLFAAHTTVFSKCVEMLEQVDGERPNLLRVVTYHRVDEPRAHPALSPRVTVTPRVFDQHMSHLAANYHVVAMPELLEACRSGTPLPPRSVLVTFDDAYRDFAEHAWPILKRHQLPVTLFVPTAFPDHPERAFWWDRLYQAVSHTPPDDLVRLLRRLSLPPDDRRGRAFSRLRDYVKTLPHVQAMAFVDWICKQLDAPAPQHSVLSWNELRQLAREGVTLGAHTRTHPLMNRISPEEARDEAVGALRDLEREIGSALPIFAYPSGGYDGTVTQLLKREGFALAFTTMRGINDLRDADRLQLGRINVGRRTTLTILRAQLLPWMVHLRRWQPRVSV